MIAGSSNVTMSQATIEVSKTPVAIKEAMAINEMKKLNFGATPPHPHEKDEELVDSPNREETITDEHFLENDFSLPDELHYK